MECRRLQALDMLSRPAAALDARRRARGPAAFINRLSAINLPGLPRGGMREDLAGLAAWSQSDLARENAEVARTSRNWYPNRQFPFGHRHG